MQKNPSESSEHEDLINMMVRYFRSQAFQNIKADIPGMPRPDAIYGTKKNHVPDLTADKNGIGIMLEAETSSSIYDDHTASQWSLFSNAARKSGGEFHIVVPKGLRGNTEQRAADLGINVDTVWTPK